MGFLLSIYVGIAIMVASVAHADPLVPILCVFGDSVVDVGNNNNLNTLIKSNFPPYGRDFVTHTPTGRFCNGKLATDFTGKYITIHTYARNVLLIPPTSQIFFLCLSHCLCVLFLFFDVMIWAAEYLGFDMYPPAYLSQDAKGKNLSIGANFASAGSGFYDRTAQFYVKLSLSLSRSPPFLSSYTKDTCMHIYTCLTV